MYPNNLILTRPVLINPKQAWGTMGKVGLKSTEADTDSALPTAKGRKKPTKV